MKMSTNIPCRKSVVLESSVKPSLGMQAASRCIAAQSATRGEKMEILELHVFITQYSFSIHTQRSD